MRRLLLIFAVVAGIMGVRASETPDTAAHKVSYVPKIGGVIRARWEMQTDGGLNRFALRNARVTLSGKVAEPIDYFLQADLCNAGKMQFLDGWVRFKPVSGLALQAGQFRMPFGVDPFRGPGNYIFANRSFIGRYVCNVRAVGVKAGYTLPWVPLTVEAGVFNPTSITDHTVWTHQKAYAAKAVLAAGDFKIATVVQSIIPDSIRINLADAAVTYEHGNWLAEAEYMYKHYTGGNHRGCHSVNVFADYGLPVRCGVFNRWSVQGRFDMQTDHSSGARNDAGLLYTTDPARRRVTLGSTLSYVRGALHCDLRVNYEKYFYNSGAAVPANAGDKVVAEIVLKF